MILQGRRKDPSQRKYVWVFFLPGQLMQLSYTELKITQKKSPKITQKYNPPQKITQIFSGHAGDRGVMEPPHTAGTHRGQGHR